MDQNASMEMDAFLLTRRYIDTPSGLQLEFWAASGQDPVRIQVTDQEAVFFAPRDVCVNSARRADVELKTLEAVSVRAHYFRSQKALVIERERLRSQGVALYESDIKPVRRPKSDFTFISPPGENGYTWEWPGWGRLDI